MNNLDKAKLFASLTNLEYPCIAVSVKDGVITDETNGIVISLDHVMYQRAPRDGIYYATEATCGGGNKGGCSIGKPQKACIGKCYIKTKCAVYSLRPIKDDEQIRVSIGKLAELLEGQKIEVLNIN